MHRERGQATVEHVGIVLACALLLGALSGSLGAPALAARLAGSLGHALLAALGHASAGPATGAPSAGDPADLATPAESARFDAALDPALPVDERPTLRDVRLQIEARLGAEQATAVVTALARRHVESLLPGTQRPLLLAPDGGPIPSPHDYQAAARTAAHDVERPIGPLSIHVVDAAEADAWLRHRLAPGVSKGDVAELAGEVVAGLTHLKDVEMLVSLAGRARTIGNNAAALRESGELPPGTREGDIVACYPVERRAGGASGPAPPPDRQFYGSPVRRLAHVAIVRNSTVLVQHELPIATTTGRSPTCTP